MLKLNLPDGSSCGGQTIEELFKLSPLTLLKNGIDVPVIKPTNTPIQLGLCP